MQENDQWPEDLWPIAEVTDWITSTSHDIVSVSGPTHLYNDKGWGTTAEFTTNHEAVVFKGCKLPLFVNGVKNDELLTRYCSQNVPPLLASMKRPGQETWALYQAIRGPEVRDVGQFEHILDMARTLATIQVTVAELPEAEIAPLSYTPIEQIPQMLDHVIKLVAERYLDAWCQDESALLYEFDLTEDILEWLDYFRPKVVDWTEELIAGEWPLSIDHVDFHSSNAIAEENGNLRIIDWEEAILSCPFFSIYRLLFDADDFVEDPTNIPQTEGRLLLTPNQMAVRNAYLDALPWQTRGKRERAFDVAMCLAPIKMAYEGEPFNEAVGRTNGSPTHAARCISHALHFWQAMVGLRTREEAVLA